MISLRTITYIVFSITVILTIILLIQQKTNKLDSQIKNNALYKIVTPEYIDINNKEIKRLPLDIKSGFIHFSFGHQVKGVINKFFKEKEVIVVKIDIDILKEKGGILKIKSNHEGGTKYPHLYELEKIPSEAIKNIIILKN